MWEDIRHHASLGCILWERDLEVHRAVREMAGGLPVGETLDVIDDQDLDAPIGA